MNTSEKVELTASICHIDNQEYRFTNPKCRTQLVEKRKTEDKGRRRSQAVTKCYVFHANTLRKYQ